MYERMNGCCELKIISLVYDTAKICLTVLSMIQIMINAYIVYEIHEALFSRILRQIKTFERYKKNFL